VFVYSLTNLPFGSRISDKEGLLKVFFTRIFWIPRLRDCRQILGITTTTRHALMAAWRCLNDLSAPSSANIKTGPETNIGDGIFKLKPALINMAQKSPLCGKASNDANTHLQHFLEICSTFTIRGVTQDAVRLCLFLFSLLGMAKQ
jgi:hypothetical protein